MCCQGDGDDKDSRKESEYHKEIRKEQGHHHMIHHEQNEHLHHHEFPIVHIDHEEGVHQDPGKSLGDIAFPKKYSDYSTTSRFLVSLLVTLRSQGNIMSTVQPVDSW